MHCILIGYNLYTHIYNRNEQHDLFLYHTHTHIHLWRWVSFRAFSVNVALFISAVIVCYLQYFYEPNLIAPDIFRNLLTTTVASYAYLMHTKPFRFNVVCQNF